MFKPMLAVDLTEPRFPYYASPKIDGIRCVTIGGEPRTRTMKLIPNRHVQAFFDVFGKTLIGLDGELTVGLATARGSFQAATSGLMSYDGRPNFQFNVFDVVDTTGLRPFASRMEEALKREPNWPPNVKWLDQQVVKTQGALDTYEAAVLKLGFEGVMLRGPASRYKQGRATVRENSLLKVKRFRDAEAVIVGAEEQMHNANPAYRNELGLARRSTAAQGLSGKASLGALIVRGAKGQPFAGIEFNIGTGFDGALKQKLWDERKRINGLVVKYRYLECGVKDKPRHPSFIGFRKE